jgi:hypothetical protein
MSSAIETAREVLATAEAARTRALEDAASARTDFESEPSPKTHSKVAVTEQLAKNAIAPVEAARAEVARLEREVLEGKLEDALSRARHSRLFDVVMPLVARMPELLDAVAAVVAEITAAVRAQHQAVQDAERFAAELGIYSTAPGRVSSTLVRAMCGLRIAQHVAGRNYPAGREPWTWIQARAVYSGLPDIEELRLARELLSSHKETDDGK